MPHSDCSALHRKNPNFLKKWLLIICIFMELQYKPVLFVELQVSRIILTNFKVNREEDNPPFSDLFTRTVNFAQVRFKENVL